MRSHKTRKILLVSVISIMICLAMLVGTTVAWFTYSVNSGKSQIITGSLTAKLEYATLLADGSWSAYSEVTETTPVFANSEYWEPGHTQAVKLRVTNNGTLAFKYELGVIYEETPGVNVLGNSFNLSDYIMAGVLDASTAMSRNVALAAATEKLSESIDLAEGSLEKNGSVEYVFVLAMPTSVDNVANSNGVNVPSIQVGVSLVATQYTSESDDFGNDYDEDAEFDTTVTEADIAAASGIVYVNNDVALTETVTAITSDATLNLSEGIVVSASRTGNSADESSALTIKNGATVNLAGKGTVRNTLDYVITVKGNATLNISGGTYIGHVSAVNVVEGTLNITGGYFEDLSSYNGQYLINCFDDNYKNNSAKVVITGGTFVNWNPSDNYSEGEGTDFVPDGYTVETSIDSVTGKTLYTVVPYVAPVHTCTPTTEWVKGEDTHYNYACSDASCPSGNNIVKVNEASHDPADGVCATCGKDNTPVHTCTPTTEWVKGEDTHYNYACSDASCPSGNNIVKVNEASHDPADGVCTTCGKDNTPVHTCDDIDGDYLCDECDEAIWEVKNLTSSQLSNVIEANNAKHYYYPLNPALAAGDYITYKVTYKYNNNVGSANIWVTTSSTSTGSNSINNTADRIFDKEGTITVVRHTLSNVETNHLLFKAYDGADITITSVEVFYGEASESPWTAGTFVDTAN